MKSLRGVVNLRNICVTPDRHKTPDKTLGYLLPFFMSECCRHMLLTYDALILKQGKILTFCLQINQISSYYEVVHIWIVPYSDIIGWEQEYNRQNKKAVKIKLILVW